MTTFGRKKTNNFNDHLPEGQSTNLVIKESYTLYHSEKKHTEIQKILHQKILAHFKDQYPEEFVKSELNGVVRNLVHEIAQKEKIKLNQQDEDYLTKIILDEMIGLGPLEPLLADDAITDILVNGPYQILVERNGLLEKTPYQFQDEQHLLHIAQRIAHQMGRRIDESLPMVDARLNDESRVNIVIPPLSLTGTTLSIRKFRKAGLSLSKMVKKGTLSLKLQRFLELAIKSKINILISGGTGAGKTTLLNALSAAILPEERIITIEDTAELRLIQPHTVKLEARPPNLEGQGEITIRDLVRNSLRMRPDRIIVGEVRGAEVIDMLQALNTGHQGSMSTIHANESKEALIRLENMAYLGGLSVASPVLKELIAGAIHLIVHIERMSDGIRRIIAVTEITGFEEEKIQSRDLFRLKLQMKEELRSSYLLAQTPPLFCQKKNYQAYAQEIEQLFQLNNERGDLC